MQIKMY